MLHMCNITHIPPKKSVKIYTVSNREWDGDEQNMDALI